VPLQSAERTFLLTAQAQAFRVGDLHWDMPESSVEAPVEVVAHLWATPADSPRPLPPGPTLVAFSASPWNPPLQRHVTVRVPIPDGPGSELPLELLGWQPAMRAYMVVATARRDPETGLASFGVRQLGDFLVRREPVTLDQDLPARCPDVPLRIGQAWPGPREDDVVGLVEVPDRVERVPAFSLLTDFRHHHAWRAVEFKNEEIVDLGATRADDRNHQSEDWMMDPLAAAALGRLVDHLAREWTDPVTGEPLYRVRVTESFDSLIEHSQRSTHYQGRAIDLTLSPVPAASEAARRQFYGRLSSLSVCAGFDYVLFENQYHVHASVVPSRLVLVDADGIAWTAPLHDPARLTRSSGPPPRFSETSPDGLRQVRVSEGRAWLTSGRDAPPLGAPDAAGRPLLVRYPFRLGAERSDWVQGGFLRQGRGWDP
jgi:hypothetical protein